MLFSLKTILERAQLQPCKKLVVAAADDLHVLMAVKQATETGIISPILVGNCLNIKTICSEINFNINNIEVIESLDVTQSAKTAVDIIKNGKADILMKGMLSTAILLRAVVDAKTGLVNNGLLSHFAINYVPTYHKLIAMTDAAMNIKPDLNQKAIIVQNAVNVLHRLGYNNPKVAVLSALEIVNPKIESSVHAAALVDMNKTNQITGCIIGGPFALDNAINKEASIHKGIKSEVAGDADLLVTPDIDSGNILYKAMNFMAEGTTAAIITGASVPIVLTSRSDSEESKLMSIALASIV